MFQETELIDWSVITKNIFLYDKFMNEETAVLCESG